MTNICVFIFLCVFIKLPVILGMSEEMQELVNMLHQTCVEETGASEDAIQNAQKGIFAEDESFKCYIHCLMTQVACIEDDGTIDEEATIAVLPEEYQEKARPVVLKCGTQRGATNCETAWLTHKCYQRECPEAYMLI